MFQKIENLWFFTSTINSWQKILNKDNCQIIIESFNFISINKWIKIYGFVLMPNHIHIVLSLEEKDKIAFQRDFLKHTAQQILFNLKKENNAEMLLKLTSTYEGTTSSSSPVELRIFSKSTAAHGSPER